MTFTDTICEQELENITSVSRLFSISETEGQGVTLSAANGLRNWVIKRSFMEVMIIGGPTSLNETFTLPLRLIQAGEIQAHIGNGSVELSIKDGTAHFHGDHGSAEMAVLTEIDNFGDFNQESLTTAEIRAYNLGHLIALGTSVPTGNYGVEQFEKVPPHTQIKFLKDSISLLSEFKEISAQPSRINMSAEITGRLGQVVVNRHALIALHVLIAINDSSTIKISCDTNSGDHVLFESANWKALICQEPIGAAAYFDYVAKWLKDDNIEFELDVNNRICAKIDDEIVVIQLLDGRLPIIHCTVELISGVEVSWDLLHELNEQNQGHVCTKFFIQNGSIFACLDLVAGKSPKLTRELRELVTDSNLLGECLASLGVIQEKLPLL